MEDDDTACMRRVAAGDEAALHSLYLSYRPRLRRFLWHQLNGNSAAVEDALQDIFVAIWRAAPSLPGVYGIAGLRMENATQGWAVGVRSRKVMDTTQLQSWASYGVLVRYDAGTWTLVGN